jgi:N-acetylglucosamine-6-sulfatase
MGIRGNRLARRLGAGIALSFIVLLATLGNAVMGPGVAADVTSADARATLPRPNIIVIQTDDQTLSQLTADAMPRTRRLLVRPGTEFTNYIASTAECCASRVSLFTGQYAHNHGVTSNRVGYRGLRDKGNLLPVWLRRSGYRTIHVGSKFLNGYQQYVGPNTQVPPGWSHWITAISATRYYDYEVSVNGHQRSYGHRANDHIGRVLARHAVRLIKNAAPLRPFYLQLDARAPHVSLEKDPYGPCDAAPIPDRRDERRFSNAELPNAPSFNEQDMSDKPRFLRSPPPITAREMESKLKKWRCALESLVSVDRSVAKVFDAVERSGERSRTVFLYLSDNGMFYGEHRLRNGKVFPYEEALHMPLLMRIPKKYLGGQNALPQVDRTVGNVDLAPTIMQLARARPCAAPDNCRTMDGRSLLPSLTATGGPARGRGLLTEYRVPDLPYYSTCQFAGIRTASEIYVEYYRLVSPLTKKCRTKDPPDVERYDLRSDPFELDNLCRGGLPTNCPSDAAQRDLAVRLRSLRHCAGIAGRDRRVDNRPFCE